MIDLAARSLDPELMDGEDVTQDEFAACMRDLAQVNTLTLARLPTLAFIDRIWRTVPRNRAVTIVDVGFGAGDMLRAIARLAKRRRRPVKLIGFDINPRSKAVAESLTPPDMPVEYRTGDALEIPAEEAVDLIISSLVTHHMRDEEVIRFLGWMEARARLGWLVNDLHRHPFPYYGFSALAALMPWHPFVRHDGPLSIARAFRRDDWLALLNAAGLDRVARVRWCFPFRYCVERAKP